MKLFLKISIVIPTAILMYLVDVPPRLQFPYFQLASEAQAIFGVRRRSFRRGVVIGSSVAATGAYAAAVSQPPAVVVQPQPVTVQQPAVPVQQAGSGLLPMGTVVSTLPKGCTSMQVSGTEYHHCGVNYYRAAFQGSNLVYVTSQPN